MSWKNLLFISLLAPFSMAAAESPDWTANDGQLILSGVPEIPPALVNRLNQYQNVRSATFLNWTRDGKGMYVRTRFGDISQIHKVHAAGGTRVQLTWFKEPIGQVSRRENSQELAITMDAGGREQDQIFLFDPDTATSRMVTDGTSRNRLVQWGKGGKMMAFQSTRHNGRSNDLWIMNPDRPDSGEMLLQAPHGSWYGPADFSKDGKHLLVQQFLNVNDSRIYAFNLKEGAAVLLAGNEESPSANRAISFDSRSEGFYLITNRRGRAAELAWQPLSPERERVYITARISWDVTEFALSHDGKRGAFVTNEEGVSRLYLLNTKKGSFTLVNNIPVGIISGLKFHPDSRQLAMSLGTAQSPNDVYVLKLGRSPSSAKTLVRWTYSEVGGLDTRNFVQPKLFHYPTFDLNQDEHRKVPAFIYKPESREPAPVIIYVHGGPESQYRPAFNSVFQMWITELGAAVIAPNIRGSSGYDSQYLALDNAELREDAVRDIGALLDWIATQPDLDASRVAVYGASYGGYVVLASAVMYSDRLRAGVDVVGISNFVTFLENTEEYRRELRRHEYGDERDPQTRAMLEQISPLTHVDQIDIPLLVVQGRNDPRVPATESEQLVQALRSRGRPVWYIEALNEGHGYSRKENRNVYEQAAILFLQQHLVK
jgi:dipeptidyl aminopeptidase/acylaminoacyl peptidase